MPFWFFSWNFQKVFKMDQFSFFPWKFWCGVPNTIDAFAKHQKEVTCQDQQQKISLGTRWGGLDLRPGGEQPGSTAGCEGNRQDPPPKISLKHMKIVGEDHSRFISWLFWHLIWLKVRQLLPCSTYLWYKIHLIKLKYSTQFQEKGTQTSHLGVLRAKNTHRNNP